MRLAWGWAAVPDSPWLQPEGEGETIETRWKSQTGEGESQSWLSTFLWKPIWHRTARAVRSQNTWVWNGIPQSPCIYWSVRALRVPYRCCSWREKMAEEKVWLAGQGELPQCRTKRPEGLQDGIPPRVYIVDSEWCCQIYRTRKSQLGPNQFGRWTSSWKQSVMAPYPWGENGPQL